MKDYYKILGVKEDASAEEIHARWFELMQTFHPDQGADGRGDEEAAKEVNEAYQVLKFSSSRMEYDFERALQRRKKRSFIKKIAIPISGVILLLIFSSVWFITPQPPAPSKLTPPPPASSRAGRPTLSHDEPAPYLEASAVPAPEKEKEARVEKEEIKVVSPPRGEAVVRIPEKKSDPQPKIVHSKGSRKPPAVLPPKEEADPPAPPERISAAPSISDSAPSVRAEGQIAEVKTPPLMATEEEVKQFFTDYVERYNRRDIHGFLLLFSPGAIQNQKEDLSGIIRIYENFFGQSLQLQYHLEDLETEIYQNAVEARARYKISQTLKDEKEKKTWQGRIQWILNKKEGGLKIILLNYQHEPLP